MNIQIAASAIAGLVLIASTTSSPTDARPEPNWMETSSICFSEQAVDCLWLTNTTDRLKSDTHYNRLIPTFTQGKQVCKMYITEWDAQQFDRCHTFLPK